MNTDTSKASAQNCEMPDVTSNAFEGQFVSITGNHLVMTNLAGKRCSHTLAQDAKLTCDGTTCTSQDFKAGRKVRVTTKASDRNVATDVETLDKINEFAPCG